MPDLRKQFHGRLRHLNILFLATDVQNLTYFLGAVWLGRDYEGTIQQIDWQTMRGLIIGSSDFGDTSVGGHDNDWSLVGLEGSVQEREALNIEHMDLIDEEHTWHDLCTAFFSPLSHFLIDLLSNLWLDLTNITGKECHEALCTRVDDINLVKRDCVNYFLALLQLALGALDVACLRSRVVEVG